MKWVRTSRWSAWAQARLIEIFRSISSPSKSVGQVPSSIRPGRVVAPAAWSIAATRVVFPTVLWPTTATLRSAGAERIFIGGGLYSGGASCGPSSRSTSSLDENDEKYRGCSQNQAEKEECCCDGFAARESASLLLFRRPSAHRGPVVTAVSCLALGVAFVVAVGLLVFAGILIGWIV